AEGLVDEVDVHRCPLQAGTMLSSGVPHSTLSPLPTWMALTVPAMSACTGVMSFITSMMHSCWPATTAVPTSTKGGAPGSGARQNTPTVDDSIVCPPFRDGGAPSGGPGAWSTGGAAGGEGRGAACAGAGPAAKVPAPCFETVTVTSPTVTVASSHPEASRISRISLISLVLRDMASPCGTQVPV